MVKDTTSLRNCQVEFPLQHVSCLDRGALIKVEAPGCGKGHK